MGVHQAPLPCLRAGLYCAVALSKNVCVHYFASMLPEDGLPQGKAIAYVRRSQLSDIKTVGDESRVIQDGYVAC